MFVQLFLLLFPLAYPSVQEVQKFYRKDYRYIESIQCFYKIHMIHSTWSEANQICTAEGANIVYPKTIGEAMEFIRLLLVPNGTKSSDLMLNETSKVLPEGINNTFDGIPISELYSNWSPTASENNKYPFICKKSYDSFVWNEECNLPLLDYNEYTYSEVTNRCYKFHLDPKTWSQAYDICSQEQSYLAIINSPREASVLVKLTKGIPKENYLTESIHLGFHNKNDKGWTTIDGTKLEDSGYLRWNIGKPDGTRRGVVELCGWMFYDGELDDIKCDTKTYFICEHEIKSMSTLRGFRTRDTQK